MSDMEKKTYRMTFRVTEKEGEFLKQVAGEEGRPVGNLIRKWLMLHYIEKLPLTPDGVAGILALREKIETDALAMVSKKKRGHGKKAA